jgi:hypothetical protein
LDRLSSQSKSRIITLMAAVFMPTCSGCSSLLTKYRQKLDSNAGLLHLG